MAGKNKEKDSLMILLAHQDYSLLIRLALLFCPAAVYLPLENEIMLLLLVA